MRPKIVIFLMLAGLAGIVGMFALKQLTEPRQPATAPMTLQQVRAVVLPAASPVRATNTPAMANPAETVASSEPVDTNALAEAHEADIQAHIDRLQELQAEDDPVSLQAILAELTSPEKEIREAAIEATIQFGSRDAIPELRELASRTDDANEKKALMDAAAFLDLPKVSEIQAQKPDGKTQDAAPPQDPPSPSPQP